MGSSEEVRGPLGAERGAKLEVPSVTSVLYFFYDPEATPRLARFDTLMRFLLLLGALTVHACK